MVWDHYSNRANINLTVFRYTLSHSTVGPSPSVKDARRHLACGKQEMKASVNIFGVTPSSQVQLLGEVNHHLNCSFAPSAS